MQLWHVHQFHAPEQARAGEPAAVGLHAGVDDDDDAVGLAGIHQLGDVRLEGRVAAVVQDGLRAVDLHGGVHHRAVQPEGDALPRPLCGDVEGLDVVGHPRVIVAAGLPGRRLREHVPLDHVVVGQIHLAPVPLPGQPSRRVWHAQGELPPTVDVDAPHVASPFNHS